MLHITPIRFSSPLYYDAVALRALLLRAPLGMTMRPEDVADDAMRLHWGALLEERLMGSVSLAVEGGIGRVKQMVVHPSMQQRGVGKQLMEAVESHARNQGLQLLVLHARATAQDFYRRLGYAHVGPMFEEVGLDHWRMEKALG